MYVKNVDLVGTGVFRHFAYAKLVFNYKHETVLTTSGAAKSDE